MKRQIFAISFAVLVLFFIYGCRFGMYAAIGPQKARKISLSIEGQESDPNIPKGLIEVGLLK